jgi:hypothetical protein
VFPMRNELNSCVLFIRYSVSAMSKGRSMVNNFQSVFNNDIIKLLASVSFNVDTQLQYPV